MQIRGGLYHLHRKVVKIAIKIKVRYLSDIGVTRAISIIISAYLTKSLVSS
jgi:hypothetical protein